MRLDKEHRLCITFAQLAPSEKDTLLCSLGRERQTATGWLVLGTASSALMRTIMRQFRWNQEKNLKLSEERGISFETVVYAIHKGDVIEVLDHPNPEKYPNQSVYAVNIKDYVYLVPFVAEENGVHFLKTIIPSRKATRQYLRSTEHE